METDEIDVDDNERGWQVGVGPFTVEARAEGLSEEWAEALAVRLADIQYQPVVAPPELFAVFDRVLSEGECMAINGAYSAGKERFIDEMLALEPEAFHYWNPPHEFPDPNWTEENCDCLVCRRKRQLDTTQGGDSDGRE